MRQGRCPGIIAREVLKENGLDNCCPFEMCPPKTKERPGHISGSFSFQLVGHLQNKETAFFVKAAGIHVVSRQNWTSFL